MSVPMAAQVHSVFAQACNVSVRNHGLITLVSAELGNFPRAIRLATPSGFRFDHRIRPGQRVLRERDTIRIADADFTIDLRGATGWRSDLSCLRIDLANAACLRAWQLARRQTRAHSAARHGIAALLTREQQPCPKTPRHTALAADKYAALTSALTSSTRALQTATASLAALDLVGLGPGLTPAGDDFLVGYLAALWATCEAGAQPAARREFLLRFGQGLLGLLNRTTDISACYLACAIAGEVSQRLADLAHGIAAGSDTDVIRTLTESALAVGSTSGADGITGLLTGLATWSSLQPGEPEALPLAAINLRQPPNADMSVAPSVA